MEAIRLEPPGQTLNARGIIGPDGTGQGSVLEQGRLWGRDAREVNVGGCS